MALQPAPAVIGPISLVAAVGLFCLTHLAIILTVIGRVSSKDSMEVAGVDISPQMQCSMGAFCLLGVPIIIHGCLGAIYRVPSHLHAYTNYLFASLLVAAVWFGIFASIEQGCKTVKSLNGAEMETMVCGLPNTVTFMTLFIFMIIICIAIYMVWSMQEQIKKRLETDLFKYQEPYLLQQELADEAAAQAATAAQDAHHNKAVPGAAWAQR
eukprot:CAMPEP_0115118522 /NCGR_PEP_ID=MMETSP0227-20121206/44542_1 /TAXON_ID=89957 /ORGANISM="Polarella glacialis, Strain CCMP 1383" /LENGTH=210 /DNA_ID=CAMNT_0002519809 /DNA_START=64 /DNA_END=696 /DNA_ORIENTATION=-